ncbi:helix-turn-helix domain-containing protein [Chitinolyticbacter meiyuanensis]|uniref:helix-turn-helix domain-containing protein n=1 Tax=Chitinolyticbacter meiyuanensis TaxID=682798 RepID=UPI001651B7E9|nr:helix-turn-helix transcriptional regulator [Chitinolyticbacter meiyuanensis]
MTISSNTCELRDFSLKSRPTVITRQLQVYEAVKIDAHGELDLDSYFDEASRADPRVAASVSEGTKWVEKSFFSGQPDSIARLRMRAGLSQRELAARLGTSQPYLAKLEKCEGNLTVETMFKLADSLNVQYEVIAAIAGNTYKRAQNAA